jgi:hypothetical protein
MPIAVVPRRLFADDHRPPSVPAAAAIPLIRPVEAANAVHEGRARSGSAVTAAARLAPVCGKRPGSAHLLYIIKYFNMAATPCRGAPHRPPAYHADPFEDTMIAEHAARRPALRPMIATAVLLMVPLVAMQFTPEVRWTLSDFVVAGILLFGTGFAYEMAARRAATPVLRIAWGAALGSALFLVWANLAVGLIGTEQDPANTMYLAVLVVGLIGAGVARLRPGGMAVTLFAMAGVTALIAGVAILAGMGGPLSSPVQILGVNGLFFGLFVAAGLLFRRAAEEGSYQEPERG